MSTKKVIEVGKSNFFIFFIQSWFCPLFCVKVIFLTALVRAVATAVNLIYALQFVFDDFLLLLISLATGIKYFNDVELLYPLDKFDL